MPKTILLIGTFDTKGKEYSYVRDLIIARGHHVLVMDAGIGSNFHCASELSFSPDISASEVAVAGGCSLVQLRGDNDRGAAVEVMMRGVSDRALQLHAQGRFDGVLGLGGSGGTSIVTAAMQTLPVGVPKVMVSTLASGDMRPYVGIKDITMMYSVVDIAGLNLLSRRILGNAAGAICGMVEQEVAQGEDKPLVAATMFGVTTPCVTRMREQLEQAGYEVLVFHATGSGGKSMEGLIRDGFISAVADMTTTEWCDELVGGVQKGGPCRLEAAARKGVPQVVSCGALDMVNFWAFETVPEKFHDRTFYKHNANVTLMRTSPQECAELGRIIAEKLNQATGPTVLLLPLKGVSAIDKEGQPFYSPAADKALFDALRQHVRPPVQVIELDEHINDLSFATAATEQLLSLLAAPSLAAPSLAAPSTNQKEQI